MQGNMLILVTVLVLVFVARDLVAGSDFDDNEDREREAKNWKGRKHLVVDTKRVHVQRHEGGEGSDMDAVGRSSLLSSTTFSGASTTGFDPASPQTDPNEAVCPSTT